MKKESFLLKVWNIVWPLFIYTIAQNGIVLLAGGIFGFFGDAQELLMRYSVGCVLVAALICIPIYYKMYRKDECEKGTTRERVLPDNKDCLLIVLSGASLALAMNNMIAVTPLPVLFAGYEETNEIIYSGSLILQILSAGIFACIVEELCVRGIVYGRLKQYFSKKNAMIISALIFGVYHLNVVQGVYAFVLGFYFVWLYERYQSLWAPCIAHISANLFVILLAGSQVFQKLLGNLVGFSLITCISLLIFYYSWRMIKESAVSNKLEFEEKEPDTLEKLTEEYKMQERED